MWVPWHKSSDASEHLIIFGIHEYYPSLTTSFCETYRSCTVPHFEWSFSVNFTSIIFTKNSWSTSSQWYTVVLLLTPTFPTGSLKISHTWRTKVRAIHMHAWSYIDVIWGNTPFCPIDQSLHPSCVPLSQPCWLNKRSAPPNNLFLIVPHEAEVSTHAGGSVPNTGQENT